MTLPGLAVGHGIAASGAISSAPAARLQLQERGCQVRKPRKRAVLHIGTHKTGTTALQAALHANSGLLRSAGICFYPGLFKRNNHVELQFAAMRLDRDSPFKRRFGRRIKVPLDEDFRPNVIAYVRSFMALSQEERFIFSAEGLSFLRYPDETAVLGQMFDGCDVEVVVYFREKKSFLEAWSVHTVNCTPEQKSDKNSWAYCQEDSWLVDYDALVRAYAKQFGENTMRVRSYEADKEAFGGTVGSFLTLLGLDENLRPQFGEPQRNVTSEKKQVRDGLIAQNAL